MVRKKALKIQERLGMKIGIAYGTSKNPTAKTIPQVVSALETLYESGLRAFVIPGQLFSGISDIQSIYKERYSELLEIRNRAQKYNIELSIHNDFFPEEPEKLDAWLKTLSSIASIIDCRSLIFHPTLFKMMPHDQSIRLVVHKINEVVNSSGLKAKVGIETTGRINEIGSLEDVIEITKRTSKTEPIINFAHIHARGAGALRTESDFRSVVDEVRAGLGNQWTQNAYLMFSGVTYGPSGIKDYVPFQKSDIRLNYLIKTIMSFGIKGTLIFEDPNREQAILEVIKDLGDMVR